MRKEVVIFADGTPCPIQWSRKARKGKLTIALDGAAEAARQQGWVPDIIAGDFDAISRSTYRHFQRAGAQFLPTPDQDYTDLEKALAWCVLRGFENITILQALGGRLDHSFTNLSLLKRYHSPERELRLEQPGESVRYLENQKIRLNGKPGRALALLPFPKCKVRSRGLAFELRNEELALGKRESACNRTKKNLVTLEIEGGGILIEGGLPLYPKQHKSLWG